MGRYIRFYKPRSYKFTNKWLVRLLQCALNATTELCSLPISPQIVLPEPSRIAAALTRGQKWTRASGVDWSSGWR
jgi:hypothetical protein